MGTSISSFPAKMALILRNVSLFKMLIVANIRHASRLLLLGRSNFGSRGPLFRSALVLKRSANGFPFFPLLFLASLGFLASCGSYERETFRLAPGKPYELREWPDSAFVASLDSLFRAEPLKQPDTEKRPEVSIDPTQGVLKAPGISAASAVSASASASAPVPSKEFPAGEMFAEKFMKALSALQSDPSNAALGLVVVVRDGENLMGLLVRAYGPAARQMPIFMVESSLRSVNSGLDLSALRSGDSVRLPQVK